MIGTVQWTTYGQGLIIRVHERVNAHPLVVVRLYGPVSVETYDGAGFAIDWPAFIEIWAELMGPVKAPDSGR